MTYASPQPVILVDPTTLAGYNSSGGGAVGGALDASFQQVTANGSLGALNQSIAISIGRRSTLTMHTTGTWVGVISLQASLDGGTTWVTLNHGVVWTNQVTGATTGTINSNTIAQASVTGMTSLRVSMTSYTSGTANVYLVASDEPAGIALDTPIPAGTNMVGGVRITDAGGTAQAAVVGASTAVGPTLPVLGVGLSPNSPLPAGTNTIGVVKHLAQANADGATLANVDEVALGAYNGATIDRLRTAQGSAPTTALAVASGVVPVTSINAATAPTNGASLDNVTARASHTLQADITTTTVGTAGTHTIQLQGSLDGVSWTNFGPLLSPTSVSTTASDASNHASGSTSGQAWRYIRAWWGAIPTSWVGTLTVRVVSA